MARIDAQTPVMFLAAGTIADMDAFAAYGARATPILEAAGGEVVSRYKATETLLGGDVPAVVFAMRFPTAKAVRDALASEGYLAIVPLRDKGFGQVNFWLAPVARPI